MNELLDNPVKSATRVLDLFELLARQDRAMSHTEIAEMLEIPKSSLTQLLKTLNARGYIEYEPAGKGYRLGKTFAQLTNEHNLGQNVIDVALPFLRSITAQIDESSAFHILRDEKVEVVASVAASQTLNSYMPVGQKAPLYATSPGKVILAFMAIEQQEDYIERIDLQPHTPKTPRTKAELRRSLKLIRKNGFAFCLEEYIAGINGIATPVLTRTGKFVGSVNIIIPTARYTTAIRDNGLSLLQEVSYKMRRQLDIVQM